MASLASKPRLLGYLSLALALAFGGWMYWRSSQQLLWGHATLFFYVFLVAGYVLLRNARADGSWRPDARLAPLAGLLLGVGFNGTFGVLPALFVGFVPLFVLYGRLRARGAGYGEVFRHGFTAFLIFNVLTTYWVTNTGFAAGFFAVLANAVLMTLPWLLLYATGRRSPRTALLAFAAGWLSFEYMHYHWELNWPWLALGNGLAQWPALVQWYEVTGVAGGTAWVLAVNYLCFSTFFAPASAPEQAFARRPRWPLALAVVLPVAVSLVRFWTYTPPPGETIAVAAVNGNFEPHYEKFASRAEQATLDTFQRLSAAALRAGPVDFLVFPETSFGQIREEDPLTAPSLRALRAGLDPASVGYLMTGFSGYHRFGPNEPTTPAVRYAGGNRTTAYEALNGALLVTPRGDSVQTYRKGVFVPGAESFPFRRFLPFMEPLVASVGGSVAGLGTQAERTPFVTPRARVAPVICYESVFGEYFTEYVRRGAQAIFVVTNDGWWGNTAGHRQHLWYSSLRAIETRRPVVRAANLGACAFIDQRGRILSRTAYDRAGFLRGTLRLNDALTPYVRYGDLTSRVALLLLVLVLLNNVARWLRPAAD